MLKGILVKKLYFDWNYPQYSEHCMEMINTFSPEQNGGNFVDDKPIFLIDSN